MQHPNHLVSPRIVLALLALAGALLLMTSVQADQPLVLDRYVVEAGDTLWTIAGGITDGGEDIRATISTVRDINELDSTVLQPGQILLLPGRR